MDYNAKNLNLLTEQLDLNSNLIFKLEQLEIKYESQNSESSSLRNVIGELNTTIHYLNKELKIAEQNLYDSKGEIDQLISHLQKYQSDVDVSNSSTNQINDSNLVLTEQLIKKTEEIDNLQSDLHDSCVKLKQHNQDSAAIISELKPEIEVLKLLNNSLHTEIARLEKVTNSLENDKRTLKTHINDLTQSQNGFSKKFNVEFDQKKSALQLLHEKTIAIQILTEEHDKTLIVIEEFKADYQQQISLAQSHDNDTHFLGTEIARLTEIKDNVIERNNFLQDEIHRVQDFLEELQQLRSQDKDNYEALLIASSMDIHDTIADSKSKIEEIANRLIGEAQRTAVDANEARKVSHELYLSSQAECEKLRGQLISTRADYEKISSSDKLKTTNDADKLADYVSKHQQNDKDQLEKLSTLILERDEAVALSQERLLQKREYAEQYISKLEEFQGAITPIREDMWVLKTKIKQQENMLELIRKQSSKYDEHLSTSLQVLYTEQSLVFERLSGKHRVLSRELKAADRLAQEEVGKSMYLNSEVTNLKLELFESRRKNKSKI
jgi:hypothetical protein